MRLPALPQLTARAVVGRPAVLVATTAVVLVGLLASGLLVARAVEGQPVGDTEPAAGAAPAASDEPASSGGDGSAGTTSGGDDNTAVALNTKDGSTVYAVRLKVVMTAADTVDAGNTAVAVSSCSDCRTVAIALEGVLVTGDAEVIAPENVALAINSGCSSCQTLAYAYQNLQTVDGKVRLTGAGRSGIAQLRRDLQGLRTSGLDISDVAAEVDRIAGAFAAILSSEVVPVGRSEQSPRPTTSGAASASGSTGPSSEPTASAEPTTSAEPAQGSPEPSPDPEPEESPSPSPTG